MSYTAAKTGILPHKMGPDQYLIRADKWRPDVASMNMARSYACAALLEGAWHVVGGNSEMRPYSEVVSAG